jgi:hypothetical protein
MGWARRARYRSWAGIRRDLERLLKGVFKSAKNIIASAVARCRVYVLRIRSALRRTSVSPHDDPESARGSNESASFKEIDLVHLDSPADAAGASAIQWILETSTDMDIITTAVQMVPEVEWPDEHEVTLVLDQLTSEVHTYSFHGLTTSTRERGLACLKATFHLYAEQGLKDGLYIHNHMIFSGEHRVVTMPWEQNFWLISSVMDTDTGSELDIISLPFSDRMWMSHILTFRLHSKDQNANIRQFVHDFISKCLHDPKTPSRLVADCLVLAVLMVGLRPRRRYLAKVDKR